MKNFRGFRVFEYALWQKAKTRKCRKSTEGFLNKKKHSSLTVAITRKLLKATNLLSKFHFGFNNKKSHFQASMLSLPWWIGATLWELHPQRTKWKVLNSLNTLRNELIKIFRGFLVFEYALWQKAKTQKVRKSPEKFLNQKPPIVNRYHYQKTTTKQFQW